jgi:hypothetical protein
MHKIWIKNLANLPIDEKCAALGTNNAAPNKKGQWKNPLP